jgi:elongation factor Ts
VSTIPASLVKELRDQTGAGMMDAKRALEETEGDLAAAQKLLRERGMAAAARRAGKETPEGQVLTTISGHVGAIVALGCETEPVSRNEEFLTFAERALEAVEEGGAEALAGLEAERAELSAKVGENLVLQGARMEAGDGGESLAEYVHPPANKIGVLVKVRGENPTLARQLAMHISFAAPRYLRREDVPEEEVAAERDIYAKQPDLESKPVQVRAKIVEGMLQKRFFAEDVLSEQPWFREASRTAGEVLAEGGIEPLAFERHALGR